MYKVIFFYALVGKASVLLLLNPLNVPLFLSQKSKRMFKPNKYYVFWPMSHFVTYFSVTCG